MCLFVGSSPARWRWSPGSGGDRYRDRSDQQVNGGLGQASLGFAGLGAGEAAVPLAIDVLADRLGIDPSVQVRTAAAQLAEELGDRLANVARHLDVPAHRRPRLLGVGEIVEELLRARSVFAYVVGKLLGVLLRGTKWKEDRAAS